VETNWSNFYKLSKVGETSDKNLSLEIELYELTPAIISRELIPSSDMIVVISLGMPTDR
jgi:hypothetical protein